MRQLFSELEEARPHVDAPEAASPQFDDPEKVHFRPDQATAAHSPTPDP